MAKAFTGNIKDNDTEWKSAVAEYLKAKKLLDKAGMRVQVAKDILLELAGGIPTKGCGILVNSSNRNGTVQYAQIVKDYEKELIKAGLKISAYTGKASVVWSVSADKSL